MTQFDLQGFRSVFLAAQLAIDRFWAATWWLDVQWWLQDRRLARALARHGEQSHLTREVTVPLERINRSMRFWRASDPLVLDVLEASARAGAPIADLQLIALTKSVRQVGGAVKLQHHTWMPLLSYLALALVVTQWALLSALIAASAAHWPAKVLGEILLTLLYWACWPGWGLYTTRACRALMRSGAIVAHAAESLSQKSAHVAHISST